MKLILKKNDNFVNKRVNIYKRSVPCLDQSWHYHPEFELLYISQSSGIRFVGDNVSPFYAGDLVLVGSYLPHLWRNDESYYIGDEDLMVNTTVIKFTANFLGEGTFENPEFSNIKKMLEQSKYGVAFNKVLSDSIREKLLEITELSEGSQSIMLLDILYTLALTEEKSVLSTTDMRQFSSESPDRLDAVIRYISESYKNEISLSDVANIACMTTNSFCRFFKKMTNKSFTEFLNEVRIRNASRMLVQENSPISEICYKVGYKSIPNFNKQFKKIMGETPKSYRYKL